MPIKLTLFPVNSVLYPGGRLTLRIIEPHELSMVSDCTRNKKPFIAASLIENNDKTKTMPFNKIGTLAEIVNFDMPHTGVLEISCRGREKAEIIHYKTETNRLIIAQIEQIPPANIFKLPRKYQALKDTLKNYIEREGMRRYRQDLEEDWDNPDWLAYRLSELLPVDRQQHYDLLIMEPLERLFQIRRLLKKRKANT